jgi:hypothetical protein
MDDNTLPSASSTDGRILMEKLGIRHALADIFHYGGYRYGRLEDAVAQARRDCSSGRR